MVSAVNEQQIELLQFSDLLDGMRTSSWDINYRFNLSRRHRFIYVETPKVACSTIKATLQFAEGKDARAINFQKIHDKELSPLLSPEEDLPLFHEFLNDETAFRFTFVRHPYTRLLSAYLDKISLNKAKSSIASRRARRSDLGLPQEGHITFEQFALSVQNAEPTSLDIHWKPLNLLTAPHLINYNFIGRFETFARDFQFVLENIGLRKVEPITRCDHATGALELLRRYYSPKIQSIVEDIYQEDFDLFGYKRELAGASHLP